MKKYLVILILIVGDFSKGQNSITGIDNPEGDKNIAYFWGKVALEATARDTDRFSPRPTITSRYLGLIFTAVFDAWSVYSPTATPVHFSGDVKLEGGLRDKEIAISYAAYHALREYYFNDSLFFKQKMIEVGLNPSFKPADFQSPESIGYQAALATIQSRKGDGSNQYQEEMEEMFPYADYTYYKPINSPDENNDINRWQPKYFVNEQGKRYAPSCLTPYWQHVKPITLDSANQFRSPPPPYYGSDKLKEEVEEVVALQSNLTIEQKGLVEFMRDGPSSVQQAGHWLLFAQEVSKRDKHSLDDDVKMYFLNQITAMDAFIACWDTKMHYDYARPYALVHKYFKGKKIKAWGGYNKGWIELMGEHWRPYSPNAFLCPPFPSYVSGHSAVSGACAEALKLFKTSDEFNISVSFVAGSYTEPEDRWQEVELHFPTFTKAAEMAGISRVLGGYHIQSDNIEGLILGRKVAQHAYKFYRKHVGE